MLKSKEMILSIAITAVFTALIWMLQFIPQVGFVVIPPGLSLTTLHIPMLIGIIALPKTKWNLLFGGFLGLMFGLASWTTALQSAGVADATIFINPLVSVLPRVLIGLAAAALWMLARRVACLKFGDMGLMAVGALVISTLAYFFFARVIGTDESPNNLAGLIFALVVLFVISAALVLFYNKIKETKSASIITTLALGAFANTILVLTAIRVFENLLFIDTTGLIGNIIQIGLATNGSIEMVAVVIVGTPIVLALNTLKKALNLDGHKKAEMPVEEEKAENIL